MAADLIPGVRCITCGSGQIMAVAPGDEVQTLYSEALNARFVTQRGKLTRAWCAAHWPWAPRAPAGEAAT